MLWKILLKFCLFSVRFLLLSELFSCSFFNGQCQPWSWLFYMDEKFASRDSYRQVRAVSNGAALVKGTQKD